MKRKKPAALDLQFIYEDTECTFGKIKDEETRYLVFNPRGKGDHKEDWPGLGFTSKKAVDGVIKRLQAISESFT